MILRHTRLALRAVLLLGLTLPTKAVPSVNVELRASFGAPPFLLELLETAAEENATAYFPLLDRIADGYFDAPSTDQELYTKFRALLQQDGHLTQAEELSSFDFSASLHSAAPRIEAYYQYYDTSVSPWLAQLDDEGCESWVYTPFSGQRHCSPELEESTARPLGKPGDLLHQLPFDRVLGDASSDRSSILYGDIMSDSFRRFHKVLSQTAKDGKTSYRVRYRPSASSVSKPLAVSGYGVELALKRTDYIVIDDRKADEPRSEEALPTEGSTSQPMDAILREEELSDLRPLSASELLRLDIKAASFVMASENPLDTLERLLQDFPKHSNTIAAVDISHEFVQEHIHNRDIILPAGFNALWINGVQIMGRDVDAFSLLEHLRRERKIINSVRELGLTGPEAIDLLSHEAITTSHVEQEMPRYDWRDEHEGGNVIMWLNDIEKDKRYQDFPNDVTALLQRTFRGQLPAVRKDVHNLIVPTDFSSYEDARLAVESLQNFVKRKLPMRIGLAPQITSQAAEHQARILYHLIDTYGLVTALNYLERAIESAGRKFGPADQQSYEKAIQGRSARADRLPLSYAEVIRDDALGTRLHASEAYLDRFGTTGGKPPMLVNGVPIPKTDDWPSAMSERLSTDLQIVQKAVFDGVVSNDSYIPELFLYEASLRRIPLLVPEDDKTIRHIDIGDFPELADLPRIKASQDTIERELVHLAVVADSWTTDGFNQLIEALLFQRQHDNVEVAFLQSSKRLDAPYQVGQVSGQAGQAWLESLLQVYDSPVTHHAHLREKDPAQTDKQYKLQQMFETVIVGDIEDAKQYVDTWDSHKRIIEAVGIQTGEKALIINGRIVGPMPSSLVLEDSDLDVLFTYERKKRLLPASLAINALALDDKAASPLAFAKISNLIALSQVSDIPEGIFEAAPTIRISVFNKWASDYTAIKVGDKSTANVQIHASIDPTSELAQRWVPIIKSLSQLDGTYTCIFLNPRERLEELPIKRFYRHVIESKPTFETNGSLRSLGAHFAGLPAEALLNMGMDLPPSWLVAPEESIHDLDNIKLSAVKTGSDIEAIYELEHILIEGHSRDVTAGPPPRGAQLVLGTDLDAHSADTIIMANLGYFQFKGNPGVYNLAMQEGRSEQIFHIDSAGSLGYAAQPGDNSSEIALTTFRGVTLFPRLSRNSGMEIEDVLEPSRSALESLADGADKLLAQAGFPGTQGSKYLSKAAKLGTSLLSGISKTTDIATVPHADINIFSVASGHLYERMLNIMIVSVMKHTNHTVKFWFIEQFLSPSFKDFLPVMAEEYGFRYEMVTYKWPHWLRGQKEKQREIWGYKILFLDVLFPLDLDKVIFVDADQIVRTDMYDLVQHDLKGAPYGFTPMCDSRTEMEGFRFWKQGYWKNFLKGLPYHISALYVVDLKKFRQIAAGDRLRQQYQMLSADPASLSNLDQDLPNHMQMVLPIHSLPQEWLWCETWCSDEALKDAKTIDLCNNPQTKEPKLERARRQVPEWTVYDDEIAAVARKYREHSSEVRPIAGDASDAGPQGEEESIQERLQREDAERERQQHVKDEL